MDNNSNQLLGWEAVADVFSSNTIDNNPLVTGNLREEQGEISDEEIARLQRQHKAPSVKDVFGNDAVKTPEKEEKGTEEPVVEDPTEEPAKDDKVVDTKEKEDSVVDTPTEGEELDNEGIQVTAFFDAVAEEMGLEVEEGEDKPSTVEELCEYFREMIEENSTPEYASEEVAQLDEFVRNGGKLEDYFKAAPAIDYETFDTTIEENQKRIVRELLAAKGFNEKQITRKIEKYEDAGILEDEAEDALEAMKDIAEERKEQLLAQQKKENEQRVERQQRFVDDVVTNIKSLKDIRGIAIPEKDKKALLNYIFKADADGLTQYQKDYSKSVKNLIESAYFTMKGDTLLDTAKKIGTSSAIKTLKQSLKNTGSSKNSKKVHTSSPNSIWSIAARSLNNI
jgi:hypothetical protein|uniref:hypothetical protein n=1 Tax=Lachnospira eligens TaxID=39485 RepID=UPI0020467B52|nr:MAG TPA: hypothetical protein [Caudoviricetes sp.]